MKWHNLIILLLALTFLNSCQDILNNMLDPAPPEFDLENRYGKFIDTTLLAVSDSFIINDRVSTQFQEKISIGQFEGFSAASLIKFTHLPDSGQTMDSVHLILNTSALFGAENGSIELGLFEVEREWDENANTLDEWHEPQQMRMITSMMVDATDSTEIDIPIEDPDLFLRWLDAGDDNYGMYIKALNDPGFIQELDAVGSIEANRWPRLKFRTQINDTTIVKDSINIGLNATIFDYNKTGSENIYNVAREKKDLLLSSGVVSEILLQFDIKKALPKNALISTANLKLWVNDNDIINESPENNLVNPNHSGVFYVWMVEDLATVQLDSTDIYTLQKSDSILTMDVSEQKTFGRRALQNLINGDTYFEAFDIQYSGKASDISVERIYGRRNTEFRPTLHIKYFRIDRAGF